MALRGLEQIISQAHPLAKQQCCLIHISRNLASKVKRADRAVILGQFIMIYRAENLEMAGQALEDFSPNGNQSIGKSWKV